MKIAARTRITGHLVLLSVLAVFFDLARLGSWHTGNLSYLIWNLFLAWVPYAISAFFIKKETPIKIFVPLFILWMLFFPNAPYLVTDVLHIVSSPPALLWYDSLLFFFFGWLGLLLGVLSLSHVHQYLKNHFRRLVSEIIIFAICLLSGFGIYLGRFERWNSWDIFLNPFKIAQHSLDVSVHLAGTGAHLIFIAAFTIFLYATYRMMDVLLERPLL